MSNLRKPRRSVLYICIAIVAVLPICLGSLGCETQNNTFEPEDTSYQSTVPEAVNINTASKVELQRIPYVGEQTAESIIEHRERFGPFQRKEEIMLISGISDKRFRTIRHLIKVE